MMEYKDYLEKNLKTAKEKYEEADISVARAASEMIKFVIEHIDFVNEEDINEGE